MLSDADMKAILELYSMPYWHYPKLEVDGPDKYIAIAQADWKGQETIFMQSGKTPAKAIRNLFNELERVKL